MNADVVSGLLIPFVGTAMGSACVFFMKKQMPLKAQRILSGFAAGVMVAASIWSLIIPALEQEESLGRLAFVPAIIGFWLGIGFLLLIDTLTPHLHVNSDSAEGPSSNLSRTTKMILAVTIHNIPEGMAVGVVYAGWLNQNGKISAAGALALAIGIAIQNLPEGAIVSMPFCAEGNSRGKAFWYGVLSGAVEPVAGIITIVLSGFIIPMLPYLLCFAAGAMLYVVVEELIPEMSKGEHSNWGTIFFSLGFTLMMVLDITLG